MESSRRTFLKGVLACVATHRVFTTAAGAQSAQSDPLPSWNDGPAKQAILKFVQTTTDQSSTAFVPPAERIATFDQDGTLWVEHPVYTQLIYCLDRVPVLAKEKPELKNVEPFKTVLSGDLEAIAKLPLPELLKIAAATLTGMTTEQFQADVKNWLGTAKDHRWKRPYTELTYQPIQEVLKYFRANGYKTYIVTGGGQDFVRVYSEEVYGIPPEQVVGSAGAVKFGYDKDGKPILTKEPKLLLNDNDAGKPEGIHLMLADVLARPLIQGIDEHASERAGVGAAMIAGIGAGVFNGYEDARKFAPVFAAVTEPNPKISAAYEAHYQRFVDVYPRLKDWF
jgi:phosphoglycolate phosphatase-like HAD superfamily hydrolase